MASAVGLSHTLHIAQQSPGASPRHRQHSFPSGYDNQKCLQTLPRPLPSPPL